MNKLSVRVRNKSICQSFEFDVRFFSYRLGFCRVLFGIRWKWVNIRTEHLYLLYYLPNFRMIKESVFNLWQLTTKITKKLISCVIWRCKYWLKQLVSSVWSHIHFKQSHRENVSFATKIGIHIQNWVNV